MRFVAYLRVSTDQQADSGMGLAIQEQACRDWIRAGRHQLVSVQTDAGRSGSLAVADRPGLSTALALVAGQADGIIVHRLDRLARDMVLQETLLAELHRLGRQLHSVSPTEDAYLVDDPDDPTRALVRRILGSLSAYERDMIRLRLRTGRMRKKLAGGYAYGRPPYGWAASRGELVKVPAEQRAIALIMKLVDAGLSYRQVADELERQGIASRAEHKRWRPGTILSIAEREKAKKKPASPISELAGASA